ncbi:MAG: phage holin family protein [bacterium]|nr:phage holin family protein [bacterium]
MSDLASLFANSQTQWIMVLIIIDVFLGVIGALIKKDFVLGKLAGFVPKGVVAYVFGFAVLNAAAQALPSLAMIASVAYILIILSLVGSILNNLRRIGLPVPQMLGK